MKNTIDLNVIVRGLDDFQKSMDSFNVTVVKQIESLKGGLAAFSQETCDTSSPLEFGPLIYDGYNRKYQPNLIVNLDEMGWRKPDTPRKVRSRKRYERMMRRHRATHK